VLGNRRNLLIGSGRLSSGKLSVAAGRCCRRIHPEEGQYHVSESARNNEHQQNDDPIHRMSDNLPIQRFDHGCLSTVQSYDNKKRHPNPEYMEGAYKLAARSLLLFRDIILDESEKRESDSGHKDHSDPVGYVPCQNILVGHWSNPPDKAKACSTSVPSKATPYLWKNIKIYPLTGWIRRDTESIRFS
jgi:hypothetical protein